MSFDAAGKEVHMMTLSCVEKDCLTRLRIGRFIRLPVTRQGSLVFCPICGGKAHAHTDAQESYWEILADGYELPVDVLKEVYNIWDSNEYAKFSDFVLVMKKEAAQLNEKKTNAVV